MYIYNSNFSVNKSINNVFNLIYEVSEDYSNSPSVSKKDNNNTKDDDEDNNVNQVALDMKDSTNINANLFKILEWNINNNWDIINSMCGIIVLFNRMLRRCSSCVIQHG